MKHLYRPLYRPAVFAGLPRGWEYVEMPPDIAYRRRDVPMSGWTHGVIAYDRRLTEDEVAAHQLEYLGEAAA